MSLWNSVLLVFFTAHGWLLCTVWGQLLCWRLLTRPKSRPTLRCAGQRTTAQMKIKATCSLLILTLLAQTKTTQGKRGPFYFKKPEVKLLLLWVDETTGMWWRDWRLTRISHHILHQVHTMEDMKAFTYFHSEKVSSRDNLNVNQFTQIIFVLLYTPWGHGWVAPDKRHCKQWTSSLFLWIFA